MKGRAVVILGLFALLTTATIATASYNVQTVKAAANPSAFGNAVIKDQAQAGGFGQAAVSGFAQNGGLHDTRAAGFKACSLDSTNTCNSPNNGVGAGQSGTTHGNNG
jgi:hypothetical protein